MLLQAPSLHQDGRFNISTGVGSDSWIVKTPSTVHKHVPANEYTAMKLGHDLPRPISTKAISCLRYRDKSCLILKGESGAALSMAREKRWRQMDMAAFETWAKRMGVSWSAIKVHLADAMEQARDKWPSMLQELPMADSHKIVLKKHMARLSEDFRILL